jgi:tellurite resistance protein
MEKITAHVLAEKLTDYLQHELSVEALVDWAEQVMLDGEFAEEEYETMRDIVSRLGVSDVKAFGLTWEDCEQFLGQLGYNVRIEVISQ